MKIYSQILQGSDAIEETARDYARSFEFKEDDMEDNPSPASDYRFIDKIGGVYIFYNWKADYYFFAPIGVSPEVKETTLIRIEKDGYGFFRHKTPQIQRELENEPLIRSAISRHNKFPNPRQEGLKRTSKHFCGYNSIELLKEWVTTVEILFLISIGFKVLAITVSECQTGSYQTIFKKKHVINTTDLTSLITTSRT